MDKEQQITDLARSLRQARAAALTLGAMFKAEGEDEWVTLLDGTADVLDGLVNMSIEVWRGTRAMEEVLA